ncbi:MAG TPA: RnfABCDGE type electron transport complex subunit D, partial [Lachnospiraceae bacterium]
MNEQLQVSSSPHVRSRMTTSFIMKMVVVSLLPATFMGIYNFGLNAIVTICICVIASVLAEALYERFLGKKSTVKDFSAVVTGLLLALNLPPKATWWMALWGSLFAIIVVKQLFGGLGQNFMNPALGARCFLMI